MTTITLDSADALRDHLDALNEAGTYCTAAGVDATGQPFLVALTGPYAEGEDVLTDSPWQGDIDWRTPGCDQCGAHQALALADLTYPVTVGRQRLFSPAADVSAMGDGELGREYQEPDRHVRANEAARLSSDANGRAEDARRRWAAHQFGLIPTDPVAPEKPLTEFYSTVVRPDGMVLTVSIKVDVEKYGPDHLELTEVTQMALARMAHDLNRNEAVKQERRVVADHPVPGGLDG